MRKPGAAVVVGRRLERWRWVRTPALAAGLLLSEYQLLAVMGTPTAQAPMRAQPTKLSTSGSDDGVPAWRAVSRACSAAGSAASQAPAPVR